MSRLALFAVLALVPSCFLAEDDDIGPDPEPDGGVQCNVDFCVTKDNPFRFVAIPRFGVGTEVPLEFLAHDSLHDNFEIVTSDPSVEIVRGSDGLTLRAHQAGTFRVIARTTQTQTELSHYEFDTADVASIELTLRIAPIETEPLASIAVLAGGTDAIGVAFRDDHGAELAGSAPVSVDDPAIVDVQPATWFVVDGRYERMRFGIVGLAAGTTRATVAMFDGRTATLPIEVVDAVATLDIATVKSLPDGRVVASNGTAAVNDIVQAVLVGKTSDGRFVAGVYATWDATGPAKVDRAVGYPTTPDVELVPTAPGTIAVTATAGQTTVTATLVAH